MEIIEHVGFKNSRTRGNKWKRLRERVKRRDSRRCRLCGSSERLRACHVLAAHSHPYLTFKIKNIVTLCEFCDCVHGDELEKFFDSTGKLRNKEKVDSMKGSYSVT